MVSSVSSTAYSPYSTSSPSSTNGAAAATSFADALADTTAQGTLVSISSQAQAAAASSSTPAPATAQTKASAAAQVAGFDFNKVKVDGSQSSIDAYNAYYVAGAAAVSASQGLPAGKYDYSALSPKEAAIVATAERANGASYDDVAGLYEYANIGTSYSSSGAAVISNTPGNALSDMVDISRTTTDANGQNYAFNDTLRWMLQSQGTSVSESLQKNISDAISAK